MSFGKGGRSLEFLVVLAVAVVDILGPIVVDEEVVVQVGLAVDEEPDIGQLPPVLVTQVLISFQVERGSFVIKRERPGGIVTGLLPPQCCSFCVSSPARLSLPARIPGPAAGLYC
jgi:hypothetical protein